MKLLIIALISIVAISGYITRNDCETDNGKRIDNCQSK